MDSACTTCRAVWLEHALEARSPRSADGQAPDVHLAGCAACAAWSARRADQVAALRGMPCRNAPDRLGDSVAAALVPGGTGAGNPFEVRLARRLSSLPRTPAPAVLERLVAEELADPQRARARRFAGDLERPAVPNALEQRLHLAAARGYAGHGRRRLALVSAASVAAAVLAVSLLVFGGRRDEGRPFPVHYGRPPVSSPLAASLADGWTVGILAAGGSAVREEER